MLKYKFHIVILLLKEKLIKYNKRNWNVYLYHILFILNFESTCSDLFGSPSFHHRLQNGGAGNGYSRTVKFYSDFSSLQNARQSVDTVSIHWLLFAIKYIWSCKCFNLSLRHILVTLFYSDQRWSNFFQISVILKSKFWTFEGLFAAILGHDSNKKNTQLIPYQVYPVYRFRAGYCQDICRTSNKDFKLPLATFLLTVFFWECDDLTAFNSIQFNSVQFIYFISL